MPWSQTLVGATSKYSVVKNEISKSSQQHFVTYTACHPATDASRIGDSIVISFLHTAGAARQGPPPAMKKPQATVGHSNTQQELQPR